jgi:hypothetical protein
MIDPSVLLGARGVQVANPLELAGKGATLAELMTRVQQGQLAVQTQQQGADLYNDPRFLALMTGQAGAGGGAPGGGGGMPGAEGAPGSGGPGSDQPQTTLADVLRGRGLAAPGALRALTDLQKTRAEIGEKNAQSLKLVQDVTTARIQTAGNIAAQLARNPTPQAYQALIMQMQFARLPMEAFGTPPSMMAGPDAIRDYANTIAAAATTPKDAAEVAKTYGLLPGDIAQQGATLAKTKAETEKTQGESGLLTYNAQTGRISANASATNAATESRAQQFGRATLGVNDLGQGYAVTPASTTGQAPTGSIAQGAQVGTPAGVKAAAVAGGAEVGELATKAQSAAQLQAMIGEMRAQEARGIYSGGIMGTEGAKRMVGLLAAAGVLPQAQADKLAHTQVFDAEAQQVVADAVSQFAGSRIAARELPFFQGTKPSTTQLAQARQDLYGSLYNRAQRAIDQAQQAGQHLRTPGNVDLSNFQPQYKSVPLPAIDVKGAPDPRTNKNATWIDDDGVRRVSNGSAWVRVGGGR